MRESSEVDVDRPWESHASLRRTLNVGANRQEPVCRIGPGGVLQSPSLIICCDCGHWFYSFTQDQSAAEYAKGAPPERPDLGAPPTSAAPHHQRQRGGVLTTQIGSSAGLLLLPLSPG